MRDILKLAKHYQSKLAEEQQAQKTPYYQQEMNQIPQYIAQLLQQYYKGNVPIYETEIKPALSVAADGKLWVQVIVKINEARGSSNVSKVSDFLRNNRNHFPHLMMEIYVKEY